jgi:hypothetical protein
MHEQAGRPNVQEFFRSVNDCIKGLEPSWPVDDYDVICECRDPRCTMAMCISRDEYEAVRAEAGQFVVLLGHEQTAHEDVVARNDRYAVVASRPVFADAVAA